MFEWSFWWAGGRPCFPSHSEMIWIAIHQVLSSDLVALGDPIFVWHLLRQTSHKPASGWKRQKQQEVVDVSLETMPIREDALGIFTIFLQPETIIIKYAKYTQ